MPKPLTTADFVSKATRKHGGKYSYAKSVYAGAHSMITITCPLHGDFQQLAGDHANVGKGCKPCGIVRASPPPDTKADFVRKSKAKHGDRYDYAKAVYTNKRGRIVITCLLHGDFTQQAGQHSRGAGCPICRNGRVRALNALPTSTQRAEVWKQRAAILHGDAYDYSRVVYGGSKKLVEIVCPIHGSFFQTPCNHLNNKCRCPACAAGGKAAALVKPLTDWMAQFREAHADRYEYVGIDGGHGASRVRIKCPTHGEFIQLAYVHATGHGCPRCVGRISRPEDVLFAWLTDRCPGVDILRGDRRAIAPYELDLLLPAKRLAVEFNGTFWHADTRKDKWYHQKKALACAAKGIQLVHIYEYDWDRDQQACLQLLAGKLGTSDEVLNARALQIRAVRSSEASAFLAVNHFQGAVNAPVRLGLFDGERLVSLMTFGRPRYGGGYQWELLRFCSLASVRVRGGAGRLFKAFVRQHLTLGDKVVSFARLDYSRGGVYEALGFVREEVCAPDYVWVKQPKLVLKRYATQKHLLPALLGKDFDPAKSESENMRSARYNRVYSAGNLRYVFTHAGI